MKIKIIIGGIASLMMLSCGSSDSSNTAIEPEPVAQTEAVAEVDIDPMEDKGVGPVISVEIGELDEALATSGQEIFEANCTACHKMGKRFVGPDLVGITERRTPEWIMNMILDPEGMVKNNKAAKELLMEYSAPMANQSLEEDQARAIYEYLRIAEKS